MGFFPIKLSYSMAHLWNFRQSQIVYSAQNWCKCIYHVVLQGAIWKSHLSRLNTRPLRTLNPRQLQESSFCFFGPNRLFSIFHNKIFSDVILLRELDKLYSWIIKANYFYVYHIFFGMICKLYLSKPKRTIQLRDCSDSLKHFGSTCSLVCSYCIEIRRLSWK